MSRWPDVPPMHVTVDDSLDGGLVVMVAKSTIDRSVRLLRLIGSTKTPKGSALLGVRFPRMVNAVVAVDVLRNDRASGPPLEMRSRAAIRARLRNRTR